MKKNIFKIICLVLCASIISGCLLFGASAEGRPGTAPFRISVTVNGDAETQRGITWYTAENTKSEVNLIKADGSAADTAWFEYEDVFEWEGNFVHKCLITNLEPGTEYIFEVGDGTTFSPAGTFVTDDGDEKFEFIAIADIQASSLQNFQYGARVIEAAFETATDAEFLVNLGDFTNDSTNEEWDYYDEAMAPSNLSTTLVPIAGNHDGLGVWNWFNNMFCLDTSESVQVLNGVNYSFDYGNAHFAVLNTNDLLAISNAQLKWLENDMNSTSKDWKIVFMHKSPYTLGKDGKWPDALYLQSSLTEVLDRCNVDLVMSGHDHQYLRTKALKGNAVNEDGTVYVLAGTAGTKRYEVRPFLANNFLDTSFIDALTINKHGHGNYWNGENWDETNEAYIGGIFNRISIEGGTLTLNSYVVSDYTENENGEIIDLNEEAKVTLHDSFTITKATGENKATYAGRNETSAIEYYIGVVPSFISLAAYALGDWLPKFIKMVPALLESVIKYDIF